MLAELMLYRKAAGNGMSVLASREDSWLKSFVDGVVSGKTGTPGPKQLAAKARVRAAVVIGPHKATTGRNGPGVSRNKGRVRGLPAKAGRACGGPLSYQRKRGE